jgi:hypothetical protein
VFFPVFGTFRGVFAANGGGNGVAGENIGVSSGASHMASGAGGVAGGTSGVAGENIGVASGASHMAGGTSGMAGGKIGAARGVNRAIRHW